MRVIFVALFSFSSGQEPTLQPRGQELVHVVAPPAATFAPSDALKVLKGISEEFFRDTVVKIDQTCVEDEQQMADWIEKSKVDLATRKTKDDAQRGLGELYEMMKLALDAFKRCGVTKTEVQRLRSVMWTVATRFLFMDDKDKTIWVNFVDVSFLLEKIMSFWSRQQYTEFGRHLGGMYWRVEWHWHGVRGEPAVAREQSALLLQ
jgi:hypothetical protein